MLSINYLYGSDYYPFGMGQPGRSFSSADYRFGFNSQEKVGEIAGSGNHNTALFWEYDTRLIRRWNIDPVVKSWESGYAVFANNPISFVDPFGSDSAYFLDQQGNPDNKRVYTADVYIVKDGNVVGHYSGSTFPNDASRHNTVQSGEYNYNNKAGHKGGTKKGLNIVNERGVREAPGTDPNGNDITMIYVNIHSGVPPEDDPAGLNRQNRGSEGCPTIHPSDAEAFFDNFNWTNSTQTTGNSTGTVIIMRNPSSQDNLRQVLETKLLLYRQSLPANEGSEIKLDNQQRNTLSIWQTK